MVCLSGCQMQHETWNNQEYTLYLTDSDGNEQYPIISFEYPDCFSVVNFYRRNEWGITSIMFTKTGIESFKDQRFLRLALRDHGVDNSNSENLSSLVSDHYTSFLENELVDINEFSQCRIHTDSVEGEYLQYSYTVLYPTKSNPADQFVKEFWFERNGCFWEIYFIYGPSYDERNYEEVGKVFDHIINTLEFFD